jgi:peptidoglycan hydrolase-like protein with peptidoglycan-binding domain
VEEIEVKLTEKGLLVGTVDGESGAKTKLVVARFQRANGLTVDDVIGLLTYARLSD